MKENKSAELLEAYKTSDIDEFEDKHGYRILQNDTDEFFNSGNYMVPGAYFVYSPYKNKDLGDPFELYEKEGGKFVNDIFGIEQNLYIDTPENREILARALLETPEIHIENWQIEVFPRKTWHDYKESFLFKDNLTLAFKDKSGCVIFDKADVTSPIDELNNVKFYLVLGNWKRKSFPEGEYGVWIATSNNGGPFYLREGDYINPMAYGSKQEALADAVKVFNARLEKEMSRVQKDQKAYQARHQSSR